MRLSTGLLLLLCVVVLIVAHHARGVSGTGGSGVVPPVRQNPVIVPGVGTECPGNLDDVVATTELEAERLLLGVVSQIECVYLGNC
jgi:hypothetical protein